MYRVSYTYLAHCGYSLTSHCLVTRLSRLGGLGAVQPPIHEAPGSLTLSVPRLQHQDTFSVLNISVCLTGFKDPVKYEAFLLQLVSCVQLL